MPSLATLSLSLALAAAPAAPPAPAAPAAEAAPRAVLDRVAATVNGEVITLGELKERAGEEWRRAAAAPPAERAAAQRKVLKQAFEVVVAEKLFRAQAVELQIEVTEAQIDQALEAKKTELRLDDRQLDEALAAAGMTRAGYREQIRKDFEIYRILDYKVRGKVKLTDEDLKNWYQTHPAAFGGEEEVRVRHIFLPLAEDASAAEVQRAQGAAERVLQRLAAGEDFAKVAREVSRGPGAEEGGDLGWMRRGTIQKQLEDVALGLADGQVSRVVRAGPGLHIFKAEARRRGGAKTFEEAKEDIRTMLAQEQSGAYRDQYVAELKRDAVIQVNMPELKD
jgi:peptidyl-prolyl cis-trans isomerase SurA